MNDICSKCELECEITKHHVKDVDGIKTGEIQYVCRECHDGIELQYYLEGRLGKIKRGKRGKILKYGWVKK